jgi:hypothetical protein
MNVSDLRKVLGLPNVQEDVPQNSQRVRRQSMEQLDLIKVGFYYKILGLVTFGSFQMTPDARQLHRGLSLPTTIEDPQVLF